MTPFKFFVILILLVLFTIVSIDFLNTISLTVEHLYPTDPLDKHHISTIVVSQRYAIVTQLALLVVIVTLLYKYINLTYVAIYAKRDR